jgi:hypothetical protein
MIYYYEKGQRSIPEDFADTLREMATLGGAAAIIKATLLKTIPDIKDHHATRAARDAELLLYDAGLLSKKWEEEEDI